MVEEIEKILDLLNFNKDTILNGTCRVEDFMSRERIIKLLDYITNLQQENEKLKLDVRYWENKWQNTRFANNKVKVLQDTIIKSANNTNKAMEQTEIYKSRCKKAIEYIKSTYFYGMRSGKTLIQKYLCDLLNILNGSGESETNSIIYSDEDVKQENSIESAIEKIWDKKLVDEYFEQLKVLKENDNNE